MYIVVCLYVASVIVKCMFDSSALLYLLKIEIASLMFKFYISGKNPDW